MLLVGASASWLVGTAIGLSAPFMKDLYSFAMVGATGCLGAALVLWTLKWWRWPLLGLCVALVALARTASATLDVRPEPLEQFRGSVAMLGRVASPAEQRAGRNVFSLRLHAIEVDRGWREVEALIQVQSRSGEDVQYGDLVLVRGRLRESKNRPGYPEEDLLRRHGISWVLDFAVSEQIEPPAGDDFWRGLYAVRSALRDGLGRVLPEPHASLLGGILVGTRSSMPADFRSNLVVTGTSHIVAVSGFNITIVAGLLAAALAPLLGLRRSIVPVLLGVAAYTLLTGPQPSAVRAALMNGSAIVARFVGRPSDSLAALAAAAGTMLAVDPLTGMDLGFQLSFLATAGLVLFYPALAARASGLPAVLREPVAVTLAAQIATLPLILHVFHTFSAVSPLANLLVAPALPPIMVAGAGLAVSLPWHELSVPFAWVSYLLLSYLVWVVQTSASLPGAVMYTGQLPAWGAAVLLAALGATGLLLMPEFQGARRWLAAGRMRAVGLAAPAGACALLLLFPVYGLSSPEEATLRVWFLDVGGQTVTLVEAPSGRRLLMVDQSPAPGAVVAVISERMPLATPRVDVVVLASQDAASSSTLLLERYAPEVVLIAAHEDPGDELALPRAELFPSGSILELEPGVWLQAGAQSGSRGEVRDLTLSYGRSEIVLLAGSAAQGAHSGQLRFARSPPEIGRDVVALRRWLDGWQPDAALLSGASAESLATRPLAPFHGRLFPSSVNGAVEVRVRRSEMQVESERCPSRDDGTACSLLLAPV